MKHHMEITPERTDGYPWARHRMPGGCDGPIVRTGMRPLSAQDIADSMDADEHAALARQLTALIDPMDEPLAVGDEVEIVGPTIGIGGGVMGNDDSVGETCFVEAGYSPPGSVRVRYNGATSSGWDGYPRSSLRLIRRASEPSAEAGDGPDHAASPWYGRRALGHREAGEGWTIAHLYEDDVLATGLTMRQLEAITDELERMARETAEQREKADTLQAEVDGLQRERDAARNELGKFRAAVGRLLYGRDERGTA